MERNAYQIRYLPSCFRNLLSLRPALPQSITVQSLQRKNLSNLLIEMLRQTWRKVVYNLLHRLSPVFPRRLLHFGGIFAQAFQAVVKLLVLMLGMTEESRLVC